MGDQETPQAILKSLTERSLQSDELGMYWQDESLSWWWYRAPIETQALMIEAYDEVAGDTEKVEELKIWLLKQKQTQNSRYQRLSYLLVFSRPTVLSWIARVLTSCIP